VKTLFVSLLALPAATVLGSVVSQLMGAPAVAPRKSGAIISDRMSDPAPYDLDGHHRYYGRSAYP
jgi:hypothetical protein